MIHNIASIIAGYIAIFAILLIGSTVAYMALGDEGMYELTTPPWAITSVGVNLISAILGGIVCALIARSPKAPLVFAVIVFILGLLAALPVLTSGDAARGEGVTMENMLGMTMFEMMRQTPIWYALANPFIGAAGIMLGASIVRKKQHAASAAD